MKKRFLLLLGIVFIISSVFSTYVAAANVKRGDALNAIISATKNDSFSAGTNKKAYKVFKDNKSFNKKLKNNINIALENKVIKKGKKFFAKKAVKRIDFAKWIYVSMKKTDYNFKENPFKTNPKKFRDVKKKSDKKVVNYVHKYGVMDGVSKNKFAPKKPVSKKIFKKVSKNLKKAINNRYIDEIPEESPTATPGVDATVAPTVDVTGGVTPGVESSNLPSDQPTSETTEAPANPTTSVAPEIQDKLTQFVLNPFMENTEGYRAVGRESVNHVKGYVGNGIKIEPRNTVSAEVSNSEELKGKSVEFSFDVKMISSDAQSLEVTLKSKNGTLMQAAMGVEATELEQVGEWKFVTGNVIAANTDDIDEFVVSFDANGGSFVIDNFNIVYAENGNYVRHANYVSDDFEVRAVVDHANGTIRAYLPKEGSYELVTDTVGDRDEALACYEEECVIVDTENQQLTLTNGYEAYEDKAGKVDYKITIGGKEYILFSNNDDASGMRNYLAYSKAQKFEANDEDDWPGESDLLTSDSYGFVDLFADGQYLGVYTMVEDIAEKSIDDLEFMLEFNPNGIYTVGDLKYDIINNGSMSVADVQAYIEDVNNAFEAFKTVDASSSQLTAFEREFARLIDVYSCVDWIFFNEYFVTNDIDEKFYVYKTEGELLRFAVWDDYSISGGNDDKISVSVNTLNMINNNAWANGISWRRNINQLLGNRWYFCNLRVIKGRTLADELAALKTEVTAAYEYDMQLWGTTLDGMDDYIDWMLERMESVALICSGYEQGTVW